MTLFLPNTADSLKTAADLLKKGKLVAFPTETVYGLGAKLFSSEALEEIFKAKGRPADNPLIVHISHISQVRSLAVSIPEIFEDLAETFFPGPLTMILPKHPRVPSQACGGQQTVAIRFPAHPVAQKLITMVGEPLVAPSANLSGKPSATRAEHVMEDFDGKIAAVLDGGPCEIGLESTVLSLCSEVPTILRPGAITQEALEDALKKKVQMGPKEGETSPLAPGMKYRHYAPKATVRLFYSQAELESHLSKQAKDSYRILIPTRSSLYRDFRETDNQGIQNIFVLCKEGVQKDVALMNRLLKACENH